MAPVLVLVPFLAKGEGLMDAHHPMQAVTSQQPPTEASSLKVFWGSQLNLLAGHFLIDPQARAAAAQV